MGTEDAIMTGAEESRPCPIASGQAVSRIKTLVAARGRGHNASTTSYQSRGKTQQSQPLAPGSFFIEEGGERSAQKTSAFVGVRGRILRK